VISQLWRPTPACARHVRHAWSCVGVILLLATPALSDTISSYNSWQWNGFSRSSSSSASSSSTASVTSLATSTATSSLTYSVSGAAFGLGGTASLSGLVYYDEDKSSTLNSSDWAISGAKVLLNQSGNDDVTLVAYTNTDGTYKFTELPIGTYAIALSISDSDPGTNPIGKLFDSDGNAMPAGTVGTDTFTEIVLGDGYKGSDYNFSQLTYPSSLISKRLLPNTDPGIFHVDVVPEPGSLALLAVAGLFFGGLTWRRCWKRRG
jgi:hypothetical protein